MPQKEFLETFPLYKRFKITLQPLALDMPHPAVNGDCGVCRSRQTYTVVVDEQHQQRLVLGGSRGAPIKDKIVSFRYRCQGCKQSLIEYFIKVSPDLNWVMKVGQYPSWSISPDKNISKMLDHHQDFLSKGLICESQGYGIGALAYYRRITEEIIDTLLVDLARIIPASTRETFSAALERAKSTRQTSEKIDLVKDLIPETLRLGNMNPLGILHRALSEGIHAESDEECLVHAEIIREALVYLTAQIAETVRANEQFTDRMQKLLNKKIPEDGK